MSVYFLWGGIGVLVLFLLIGLGSGLVRGLKRSSLHILFLIGSVVLAYFITKPITNAILGATITVDGIDCTISQWLVNLIQTNFDLSSFGTATAFLEKLPNAIVSPILFLLTTWACYLIFDIIYLIVARVSFGSKKTDFEKNKPYRSFGGLVGIVESFLFLFIMFAPLTALTKTYETLAQLPPAQVQTLNQQETNKMQTIGEMLATVVPPKVTEGILAYNDCVIGKIAGLGGLDNAIFDGLSDFDLNGEKISIRKEIINLSEVYNEFSEVYNNYIDKSFETIDLTNLKEDIDSFIENGLFKTVVADSVNEFIINYDEIKIKLNLQNVPQIVEDIIKELQSAFSSENFDTYEYLKHDISQVIEVVDTVFKSDIITKYENLTDKSFMGILELINSNQSSVSTIAQNAISLNLVKDSFTTLGNFASQKMEEFLVNDKGLEIGLNVNIDDKNKMITELLGAVNKFLDLNKVVDISALLNSSNITDIIANISDVEAALTQLGTTFDSLRDLELLILPATDTRLESVYVFDNILKIYNLDLLNDEVYSQPNDVEKTKLDTYTKFFQFLKTPVIEAQKIGLLELGNEGVDFSQILTKLLTEIKTDDTLLSKILLPFYQLNAMDLKTNVFDNAIQQITANLSIIDLTDVVAENNYTSWKNELNLIGKTLKELDQGAIQNADQSQTYFEYIISQNFDIQKLMDAILQDGNLSNILDPVFSAKSFDGLINQIFASIDSIIQNITGVNVKTDLTNLVNTKTDTITTIEELLNLTTSIDTSNMCLSCLGKILDVLKINAYNSGTKDGVFNEIYTSLIWYLTGDDISGTNKFAGMTPNANASDIKAYLKVLTDDNFVGYYTIESFKNVLAELGDVINFAKTLNDSVSGIIISNDTIGDYVLGVKTALDSLDTKTEVEKIVLLENMRDLINENGQEILSTADKTNFGELIKSAINTEYSQSPNMATALLNLLGLGD